MRREDGSGRRTIRLPAYDYTRAGTYFVTIVTFRRILMFGRVAGARVEHTGVGQMVVQRWQEIPLHFPEAELGAFVVMPNHLHGIVAINDCWRGTACCAPTSTLERFAAPVAGSFPTIIRSFKAAAARDAARRHRLAHPLWQRGYYERIVRDDEELNRIREYIEINPMQWELDRENPDALKKNTKERWES
jgi:REP element-mobilizing transposase RayT